MIDSGLQYQLVSQLSNSRQSSSLSTVVLLQENKWWNIAEDSDQISEPEFWNHWFSRPAPSVRSKENYLGHIAVQQIKERKDPSHAVFKQATIIYPKFTLLGVLLLLP